MLRNLPFILLGIILAIIFFDPWIPLLFKQFLYSVSLTIRSVIILLLPFIIFGLLFKATVMLSNKASKIIGLILVLVCCSNFISTFFSHYVGMMVYNFDLSIVMPEGNLGLKPLWSWELPKLIANDVMMFSGIILAIIFSKLLPEQVVKLASKIETIISIILTGMASTIPFFVAGFVVKLQHDNVMMVIIKDYYLIFAVIALAQFSYISLIYLFLNKMELKSYIANIKNMLPAAIVGFSTMSSISSLPLTIIGAEKNAKNKYLARMVIPATASIHLIGDCFAIPIFAYAVLKSFGIAEPSLINYMIFAFYFVLAKFSVAAVPGGGILVMLPILEKYLGFNADMMSLITALYILFDPVITCANILGNGAFAKIIEHCISLLEYKGKKSIRRSA